ncbi:MAG: lipid-binding SYLF domain-containing protein [Acidobacteria bacterium]|nr:lipid-binding SYLF domain-containing protein [Acidobacteriota bacterium]
MKWRIVACAALVTAFLWPVRAVAQQDQADRIRRAIAVFEEIMQAPDKAVPNIYLKKAEAIVVLPGTIKGGFGAGIHRGHGILSVRDPKTNTWSPPAFMTLTGGSFGAQIGVEEVDIVLIVLNQRGIENLLRNQFKIGADAGVAAGPVGRDAEASTDIQMRAQILSYSRTRGLFAGATLKGSALTSDGNANSDFYGRRLSTSQIVYEGVGATVDPVPAWIAMLKRYFQ